MTDAMKDRVITAQNPSPLTGRGTNTFLLGRGQIAVIDPGPTCLRIAQPCCCGGGRSHQPYLRDPRPS